MRAHLSSISVRPKWRWIPAVLLTFITCLAGLLLWFGFATLASHDPLFRGKPESEWIKNLRHRDDQQLKEWRAYGEEGVQVLIRGLRKANHPGERAYRRWNRILPAALRRCLPTPKPDSTRSTREDLVSLLSALGSDATSAAPVMIWTARNDEVDSLRQSAIVYFITSAGDNCLLNQLPANQKHLLLPILLRALQDPGNRLRVNAAILLKCYPEQRRIVAPVLVKALQDPQTYVRLCAAESLNRVAPDVAKKAGATSVLVGIVKDPDAQLAFQAVAALGRSGSQPDLAVPALIQCLQNTNTLISCEAACALEWSTEEFTAYSETIIPALGIAAQRKDHVANYARAALARWNSRSNAKPGPK